jgi:thiol-disulfide isomerase/thioredoxin
MIAAVARPAAPEVRGVPSSNIAGAVAAVALLGLCVPAAVAAELAPWTGGAVPGLELDTLDHGRVVLADQPERPVIVHFFATWCAPCVEEMASLGRLAARRSDLDILAVDVGEVDARVRSFFRERPVGFPVLLDRDRAATRAWGVVALPSSFVLDADLVPALFAGGDVDWDDPGVNAALDRVWQDMTTREETNEPS